MEELVVSGASVIAIHDTTLGPALGGVRMRQYADPDDAVRDATNLAEAMTYKSALAGLELGGGKSVINAAPGAEDLLAAHGRLIASLGGRYIPGADMGTGAAEMEVLARYVPRVSSLRDPSPFTARGVLRALDAAAEWSGLEPRRVAVQGLGKVGMHLVSLLRARDVLVLAADIDPSRVRYAVEELGAEAVPVDDVLLTDADVLCPCAAGGVLTEPVVDQLKTRMVVPGANNALAVDAGMLAGRGIVFVPDFVANAGGVIACEAEVKGSDDAVEAKIAAIGDTTTAILDEAARTATDVVSVAVRRAQRVIQASASA